MSLILIGFMGAGKSSLARRISNNVVDLDDYLSKRLASSVADYIETNGLDSFRLIEAKALAELIDHYEVIATGGGVVESEQARSILRAQKQVIYLKGDFPQLVSRIEADQKNRRPLYETSQPEDFKDLYQHRTALYESLADKVIDTTDKTLEQVFAALRKLKLD